MFFCNNKIACVIFICFYVPHLAGKYNKHISVAKFWKKKTAVNEWENGWHIQYEMRERERYERKKEREREGDREKQQILEKER